MQHKSKGQKKKTKKKQKKKKKKKTVVKWVIASLNIYNEKVSELSAFEWTESWVTGGLNLIPYLHIDWESYS